MAKINVDLHLPSGTKVGILSDVHVGDGSPGDLFGRKDDLFLATLEQLEAWAEVVVINGDAFDHVQARSAKRMENAHPRVCRALRELSQRKPVIYILGNHENPKDMHRSFPHFEFAHGLSIGDRVCITHGHQFDIHWEKGGGGLHLAARFHGFLEGAFRQPIRQPFRDYDNPLNRLVHRLFFHYTQGLRLWGALHRTLGSTRQHEFWERVDNFWARGQWGDLGCIFQGAESYLKNGAPWQTLVLGHSHNPGVVRLDSGQVYANVGSWALEYATYAKVENDAVRVFDAYTGKEYRDERYRMLVSGADLPDMAGWFRRYYRFPLRYDLEAIHRDFPADLAHCDPHDHDSFVSKG